MWSLVPTRPFQNSEGGQEVAGGAVQHGLPAIAGHTLTPWQDTLVILGGHSKVGITLQLQEMMLQENLNSS